ncbi:pilus assembly PilX family protein [Pistricoccus aurantiacus]|uniref:pilus assembly PilX family protein n=1 Tax=Pistricoccus aurantiacus TaxID=1883414 RepID=UPI00362C607D
MPPRHKSFSILESHPHPHRHSQAGAALVVGLIFLMLMTMLGLSAMQSTVLQERMAGNLRDHEMAFQAAEAALRKGEGELIASPAISSSQRLTEALGKPLDQWAGSDDVGSTTHVMPGAAGVAANPLFYVGPPIQVRIGVETPPVYQQVYTVTARGVGGRPTSVVILQSLIKPVQ